MIVEALRQLAIVLLAISAVASIMGCITGAVTVGPNTGDWGLYAVLGILGLIASLSLIAALVHGP